MPVFVGTFLRINKNKKLVVEINDATYTRLKEQIKNELIRRFNGRNIVELVPSEALDWVPNRVYLFKCELNYCDILIVEKAYPCLHSLLNSIL